MSHKKEPTPILKYTPLSGSVLSSHVERPLNGVSEKEFLAAVRNVFNLAGIYRPNEYPLNAKELLKRLDWMSTRLAVYEENLPEIVTGLNHPELIKYLQNLKEPVAEEKEKDAQDFNWRLGNLAEQMGLKLIEAELSEVPGDSDVPGKLRFIITEKSDFEFRTEFWCLKLDRSKKEPVTTINYFYQARPSQVLEELKVYNSLINRLLTMDEAYSYRTQSEQLKENRDLFTEAYAFYLNCIRLNLRMPVTLNNGQENVSVYVALLESSDISFTGNAYDESFSFHLKEGDQKVYGLFTHYGRKKVLQLFEELNCLLNRDQ